MAQENVRHCGREGIAEFMVVAMDHKTETRSREKTGSKTRLKNILLL